MDTTENSEDGHVLNDTLYHEASHYVDGWYLLYRSDLLYSTVIIIICINNAPDVLRPATVARLINVFNL